MLRNGTCDRCDDEGKGREKRFQAQISSRFRADFEQIPNRFRSIRKLNCGVIYLSRDLRAASRARGSKITNRFHDRFIYKELILVPQYNEMRDRARSK